MSTHLETEVTMLFILFITGVLMALIGHAMDKSERARQDREWEEVLRRRRASHRASR